MKLYTSFSSIQTHFALNSLEKINLGKMQNHCLIVFPFVLNGKPHFDHITKMDRMTLCWIIVFCRMNFRWKNGELSRQKSKFINYLSFPQHTVYWLQPAALGQTLIEIQAKVKHLFVFCFPLNLFFFPVISCAECVFCFILCDLEVTQQKVYIKCQLNNDVCEMYTHFAESVNFSVDTMMTPPNTSARKIVPETIPRAHWFNRPWFVGMCMQREDNFYGPISRQHILATVVDDYYLYVSAHKVICLQVIVDFQL